MAIMNTYKSSQFSLSHSLSRFMPESDSLSFSIPESFDVYEAILTNLGTSKQSWIQLLQYNNINYIWQETLDFLLQTDDDLVEWNKYWRGDIDNLIDDISNYRQYRIEKSHSALTLSTFTKLYNENAQTALEKLFVEPINVFAVTKLNSVELEVADIYSMRMQGNVERVHSSWCLL